MRWVAMVSSSARKFQGSSHRNWGEPSRLQSSARVDVHEPLPARLVGEAIVEAFAGLNRLPDPDELAKPSPRPPFHAQRRQAIGRRLTPESLIGAWSAAVSGWR